MMSPDSSYNIDVLRALCIDMIENAKSGHPGSVLSLAPLAYILFKKFMRYNPSNPNWSNRDRFVLSSGHCCTLLYSVLHLTGYGAWTVDVLKNFRKLGSMATGHPEGIYPGVEVTTGPLGQGLANGVGMAIAQKQLAARFNKAGYEIVNNRIYVVCGDGCLQEGITSEASSLAGHLKLNNLVVIYDDNKITVDGGTELSFTEDVSKRYESYGWYVQHVEDGMNDHRAIIEAISNTFNSDRPSFIKLSTVIGVYSLKEGMASVHGSPLGPEDVANVKKRLSLDPNYNFDIPNSVYEVWNHTKSGMNIENEWNELFTRYEVEYPELAAEYKRRRDGILPDDWEKSIPTNSQCFGSNGYLATRKASGYILNELAKTIPELIGGSADLSSSTFAYLDKYKPFLEDSYEGRNIYFGVREHAMLAILNGISAYGFFIPFGSSFVNFIGYALGALNVAALTNHHVIYIFSHDSIGVGEDGPTHQPVEKFMTLRSTPNLLFFRPADSVETSAAYIAALSKHKGPSFISLSRQTLPPLLGSSINGALKGAYTLKTVNNPQLIIVATGSEVHLSLKAIEKMQNVKISLVSFPSWELFEQQDITYKLQVFPPNVPILSIEAGSTIGWERYAHCSIGIDTFGASGPADILFKKFGFSIENIIEKSKKLLDYYHKIQAPSLISKPF